MHKFLYNFYYDFSVKLIFFTWITWKWNIDCFKR